MSRRAARVIPAAVRCVARALVLAASLHGVPAWADSPAQPHPYATVVGDAQQWLFVMLPGDCMRTRESIEVPEAELEAFLKELSEQKAPGPDEESACPRGASGWRSQRRNGVARVNIERRIWQARPPSTSSGLPAYTASGLYPNDGSTEPLWTVDWYAFGVLPSGDGEHLVRLGPWAGSVEQLAVAFYQRGRLLRRYTIKQLVSDPESLPRSVSHFQWRGALSFDAARKVLVVATLSGDRHVFDVSTGALLLSHRGGARLSATVHATGAPARDVENLSVCWSRDLLIGRSGEDSARAVQALRDLGRLERVDGPGPHPVFRAVQQGGKERLIHFPDTPPSLCAMRGGVAMQVPLDEVQRLELR